MPTRRGDHDGAARRSPPRIVRRPWGRRTGPVAETLGRRKPRSMRSAGVTMDGDGGEGGRAEPVARPAHGRLMLAPSLVILGVRHLPLGQAVWLGQTRCNARGRTASRTGGTIPGRRPQPGVPGRPPGHGEVRPDHRAARDRARHRLAVLADKYLRGIGIFRAIFSSTIATTVAVASLMWLFLLEPSVGVLSNVSGSATCSRLESPGLFSYRDSALPRSLRRASGPGSGSRSSSSPPGSRGSPATCTRRRLWTEPRNPALLERHAAVARPTLLFVVIVLTTRAFQAYGEIDLLTDGGPRPSNATTRSYLTEAEFDHQQQPRAAGSDGSPAVPRPARALVAAIGRHRPAGPLRVECTHMTVDATTTYDHPRAGGPSVGTGCSSWWP